MARRYVVSYDISDDKRRQKVFKALHGFGDHVQYSVFMCELSDTDLVRMRTLLRQLIHEREDQVLIADLGHADAPVSSRVRVLGRALLPPSRTVVI